MLTVADFGRMINGASYAEAHPEINRPNVFSISTLAKGVRVQVNWKLKTYRSGGNYTNFNMFLGKAIHEYFQARLEGWEIEKTVQYYMKTNLPKPYNQIILIGHVDAFSEEREVLDFKAGIREGATEITPLMIRQVAAYAFILDTPDAYILRVNHALNLYKLSSQEIIDGWHEIKRRALLCAQILSSERGTVK